ncbi:MAG: hypothetical protein AAF487_06645 [Bacteroidota bacterium]
MTKNFFFLFTLLTILSCSKEDDPILGCTDSTANNYNAQATEDDGSCTFDIADSYVGFWDVEEMQTVSGMTITVNYTISMAKLEANKVEITNFRECVPIEALVSESSMILSNLNELAFGECFIDNANFNRTDNTIDYTLNSKALGLFMTVEGSMTKQ